MNLVTNERINNLHSLNIPRISNGSGVVQTGARISFTSSATVFVVQTMVEVPVQGRQNVSEALGRLPFSRSPMKVMDTVASPSSTQVSQVVIPKRALQMLAESPAKVVGEVHRVSNSSSASRGFMSVAKQIMLDYLMEMDRSCSLMLEMERRK